MHTAFRFGLVLPLLLLVATAHAEPIRVSTSSVSTLGSNSLGLARGDVGQLLTSAGTATLFFDESNFANSEQLDAFHVLPNGHFLLSTAADATIGSPPLSFRDGDIVEYDPAGNTASLFFSETANFTGNADVDAVSILPNGNLLLSTDGPATIGALSFGDGDLIEVDPTTGASVFLPETVFGSNVNVDAVHALGDGRVALSVATPTGTTLGGVTFRDGDVVAYDIAGDTATLIFSEDEFAADENVDALDLGCGNGIVEGDEECDDMGESASCNANCTIGTCGDGRVNETAGETCDDGNLIDGDGCDSNCSVTGCGNGVVTGPEQCDDGGESATCDTDCTLATCGDGTINATAGEECDDAGESATCDADCTAASCGDGTTNGAAGEQCDDGGESATCDTDCTPAACGDSTANATAGEQCDDGNTAGGDCCSAGCQFEAAASPCPDDGDPCTTVDACDGAGTCEHLATPLGGCFVPSVGQKAILQFKNKVPDSKDTFDWKWVKGEAVTIPELGNPVTTDDYTLCIYDESAGPATVLMRAAIPAGGLCGAKKVKPCWRATKKGFKYVDKAMTPDGVLKLDLKSGETGKSKVLVKGKGADIPMPALPLSLPLRVQLHGEHGECFEAAFSAAGVKKNDPTQFKAKAD